MKNKIYIIKCFCLLALLYSCNTRIGGTAIATNWQKINIQGGRFKQQNNLLHVQSSNNQLVGWSSSLNLKNNYQLSFDIKKNNGLGDFCTVILSLNSQQCVLVLGALNDTLVGISNINGASASENYSAKIISLENSWHKVRVNAYKNHFVIEIDTSEIKIDLSKDKLTLPTQYVAFKPFSFLTRVGFDIKNFKVKIF